MAGAAPKPAKPAAKLLSKLSPEQLRVRRLLAPFRRKGADGRPYYSKADRKIVYQLLLVTLVPPGRYASLRPELQTMVGELSRAAGAQKLVRSKDSMAALQLHFQKNPPNPELLRELNVVLKSLMAELEDSARRVAATQSKPTSAELTPPPAPAAALGPLAPARNLLPASLNTARDAARNSVMMAARRFR